MKWFFIAFGATTLILTFIVEQEMRFTFSAFGWLLVGTGYALHKLDKILSKLK